MKAQIITQFGQPQVFQLTEVSLPKIKPGYVLIKVHATSVNQIDCKIRSGAVPEIAPKFPAILHGDVAGTISEVGAEVTQLKPGDEVFACGGGLKGCGGALAEWMLVDAKLIAKKPKKLSMLESAALPLVGITAWEGLFKKYSLSKNQHILIHGGIGGVGHIAVQLAKWCGARVAATVVNPSDFSIAKNLGADDIINVKEEEVSDYVNRLTQGRGFEIIFDTVGGQNLANSFKAAAKNGTVVTTAARTTQDLSPLHNKALSLHCLFMLLPLLDNQGREEHGQILSKISEIVDQGKLKPLIDTRKFT